MNFFKSKNFKYGSAAVALTAAVIAIVVAANVLITALGSHFGWYADISAAGLSTFSQDSLETLDAIDGENNRLTLYFFTDENTLASDTYGNYILSMTKQLDARYDFFSVTYISDLDRETFLIRSIFGDKKSYSTLYQTMYENSEFVSGTMVLRNDTYEMGTDGSYVTDVTGNRIADYRLSVFSVSDMYSATGDAFLGEYRLMGQIGKVCHLAPTAYFLTGHGEMTLAEDGTYGNAEYLVDLFDNAGFSIEKLNLSRSDLTKGSVSPTVAVIFAPQSDFTTDELARLEAFVAQGGHVMFFADGERRKLDNLNGFLQAHGIDLVDAKFKSQSDASVSVNGFSFAAAATEHTVLTAMADTDSKIVVSDCRVLRADSAQGASILLAPPKGAALFPTEVALEGQEAVAILSDTQAGGTVFACGAATVASSLIYEPAYANRDFLLSVLQEMGAESVPLNIGIDSLATDGLDLTMSQAITVSVLLSLLPSLLFVGIGIAVYIRRKRS